MGCGVGFDKITPEYAAAAVALTKAANTKGSREFVEQTVLLVN